MGYFVSRQRYYYTGESVVEVESNGSDCAGPDMLVEEFKDLGEGQEFDDPREAIEAAIKVRDAWKATGEEVAGIAFGTTGGMFTSIEVSEATDEELREAAKKAYDDLPKCDRCGDLRDPNETYTINGDKDFGEFCSENCAETVYYDSLEADQEAEEDQDEVDD